MLSFRLWAFLILIVHSTPSLQAQSANWTAVKPTAFPTNISGQIHGISRVSQLKFHPSNSNKLYAISARGGLFISNNGGTNWTVAPGTDNMPYARLASVCVDFSNDQVIYLGTGDHNYYYSGSGVWKSTNGGTTFTQLSMGNRLVVDMIMDPLDNQKIVAITDAGIYKTSNAGSTWVLKTAARPFDEIKQKTPTSRVLYAATTDSAFFRSTDFGETWSQITTGIVLPAGITNGNGCRLAVTPADTNVVYFAMVANGGTIYKSTDGGTTFSVRKNAASPYLTYYTNSSGSSGQGDYNFGIGVDRTNANILYVVAHCVWKSTDGGSNWSQLTNWWATVHTDMHQVVVNPYNTNQLWNANDGGLWISTDAGVSWSARSDGLYGYEIYHGGTSPTNRDMMSIGTQDNGELFCNATGWVCNRGGDWGSPCAFDYRTNSSMVYYFESNKRRLVTGGESTYGLPARVVDLDDITFHRSNPDLAFVADSFIYRTTNLTAATPAWTQIAATGKKLMAIHSSFADPNRLYAIASDGTFLASTNALSASPTFTSTTLPNISSNAATITSIKNAPNTLYVTSNTQVYKSVNNGATWTTITYNLPSVNHIRIIADEYYSNSELVFVASNNAVYYKVGSASTWTLFTTGLPSRTTAIDLGIYNDSTANTALRYFSYGRGVWETSISSLRAIGANFAADNPNPCVGTTVQFSDLSTGNVTTRNWSFPGGNPSSSTAVNPSVTYPSSGTYNVSLTVGDGVSTDTKTQTNYISTLGASIPFSEGFEGSDFPPAGWINNDNSTQGIKWNKTTTAGGFGTSTSSILFDNYSWNYPGEKDEILVKRLNFGSYATIKLKFDVAYQVFSGYSDSLAVWISTNCGLSFTKVWQKGGTVLSTAGSGGNNFVPTAAQWRTDSVDLSAYTGQNNVIISFQNINGYGNKLYLDNINISGTCTAPTLPTLSATSTSVCAGAPVTLNINSGSLNGAGTWSWYSGSCGGTLVGTGNSVTVNPVSSTTYYVRGEGGCLSAGGSCASITMNVLPVPSVSASDVSTCSGTPVLLTGSPSGGSFNVVNPYSGPGGTFIYTYTNTFGCSASDTANITVFPLPAVSANASPNDSVCIDGMLTLQGSGAQTYSWSNGTQYPFNGVAFFPNTSSVYTVTGTDANGCSSSSSIGIEIMNYPPSGTGASRCGPGAVTLQASGSGTIRWYQDVSGGTPLFTGNTFTPSPSATTTYYADATYVSGTTGSVSAVGPPNNSFGSGLQSTLAQYMLFNVLQNCTLQSVIVYPGAAGNVVLEMRNASGTTILNTTTLAVSAAQIGQPVLMTLNWPLTVGTGYRLYRGSAGVSLFRNGANATYPYSNSQVVITGNSLNPAYYFWAYNWSISTLVTNYCTSTRVPVTATIHPLPTVIASPVSGCTGTPIALSGNPTGGTYSVANPYIGSSTTYTYTYTDGNNCTATSSPASVTVLPCNGTLQVKVFLQGYYVGSSSMTPVLMNEGIGIDATLTDTVTVELRNAVAPYAVVFTQKAILKTNGLLDINTGSLNGNYYLVLRHRNTLPVWSAAPIAISASGAYYDFSSGAGQSYGNNAYDLGAGIWGVHSGELVSDENIDLLDLVLLEGDISNFLFGYVASDLNGDGNVDLLDYSIIEPNVTNFIFSNHP